MNTHSPGLNYLMTLATSDEKEHIMKIMVNKHRQTMNLRTMPTAKLLLLKDEDNNHAIAGWVGADYETMPAFPELFSLFIMPDYRKIQLSLILKHMAYSILYFNGISKAYARMEAIQNKDLIQYNLQTGAYRLLPADEINVAWKENCFKCELYNNLCQEQAYLEMDIIKLFNDSNAELGALSDIHLPKAVVIENIEGHSLAKWTNV